MLLGLSSLRRCCSQLLDQNVESEQVQMRKRLDFSFLVHQHRVQQVNNYLSSGSWEVVSLYFVLVDGILEKECCYMSYVAHINLKNKQFEAVHSVVSGGFASFCFAFFFFSVSHCSTSNIQIKMK